MGGQGHYASNTSSAPGEAPRLGRAEQVPSRPHDMLLVASLESIIRIVPSPPVARRVNVTRHRSCQSMGADCFDRLTKTLNSAASRRLTLRGLGVVLAASLGFAGRNSTQVTAQRGGNGNGAIIGVGGRRRRHDSNHHRSREDHECRPKSRRKLCKGKCDRVVNDGCGGKVDCACRGGTVCAPGNSVCCQPAQLCAGKNVCCAKGEVCGPGDACCPAERACFPSNQCCPAGEECTVGGGTCCPSARVCRVGGVAAACCPGLYQQCVNGVCV